MKGVSSSNGILNPDWFQTSTSNGISSKSNTRTESRDENIDKDWQSDVVHNKLTSYIQKTADKFLDPSGLEKISEKFKAQLKSLSECHKKLAEKVKNFDALKGDAKIALGGAIAKMHYIN
jgi:U3 small nucleolar ribonucleoprotein component